MPADPLVLERFRARDLAWTAQRGMRSALEELCHSLSDPGALAGAALVKRSLTRSVWRLPLAGRTVYLKRYRVRSRRERLKYLVARPRARAEWRAALRLREAGIEAAEPLAVALGRRGPWLADAWFVAGEVPGLSFREALAELRAKGTESVAALLRETAALLTRLEAAGLAHPDLHGANLLVQSGPRGPRLALIDLHSLRLGRLRAGIARRSARAKLAHSLWRLLREDELALALRLLAPGRERRLRRAAARIERRRLRSRTRRCLRSSSRFAHERAGGFRVWRRRTVSLEELLRLAAPHGEGADGAPPRLRAGGALHPVRVVRRRGAAALAGYRRAFALEVRGVPARRVYACLQRRFLGRLREALLVVEELPGGVRLDRVAPARRGPALVRAAVEVAARHHRAGLGVAPRDLLAAESEAGWRVVRARPGWRSPDRPLAAARIARELARIRAAAGG